MESSRTRAVPFSSPVSYRYYISNETDHSKETRSKCPIVLYIRGGWSRGWWEFPDLDTWGRRIFPVCVDTQSVKDFSRYSTS